MIVQKHKDESYDIELPTGKHGNKTKSDNLFKDWNDSSPIPFQNKDFPEAFLEATINTSNTGTTSVHDALIAHNELEQLLTKKNKLSN